MSGTEGQCHRAQLFLMHRRRYEDPWPTAADIGGSAYVIRGTSCRRPVSTRHGYGPKDGQPGEYLYIATLEVNVLNCRCPRNE
jgi:hypothetical protein